MASVFENVSNFADFLTKTAESDFTTYQQVYDEHRHRIYALAFWMTDNELAAEELMESCFRRAFLAARMPSAEALDSALISQLRELIPLGELSLNCPACATVAGVRRNTRRVDLERAVVQLPYTERLAFLLHDVEGYDHERVSNCLGLSGDQSQQAVHQARLRIRELLAAIR